MMSELSLSSSDLTLIVTDFDPEHIEKVMKIGFNNLGGISKRSYFNDGSSPTSELIQNKIPKINSHRAGDIGLTITR